LSQVEAHKELLQAASHADFVAAVLAGGVSSSQIALSGLGDPSEEIRETALSAARAACSGAAAAGKEAEILTALAANVDGAIAKGAAPGSHEVGRCRLKLSNPPPGSQRLKL
jgi:hypothetical protein